MRDSSPVQSAPLVIFEPDGHSAYATTDETLLDTARKASVRISAICGGRGLCRACAVRISSGLVPEPSEPDILLFTREEIDSGWRRACQCTPVADCSISVPARSEASPLRNQVNCTDINVRPDPSVRVYRVRVPAASPDNFQADDQRLLASLNLRWPGVAHKIDPMANLTLSGALRDSKGSVKVAIRFGEVLGVLTVKSKSLLGLAIDLGTTNIGILLVDLRNGRTLLTRGAENPQQIFGGDVLTRLNHAMSSPTAINVLQQSVVDKINQVATEMCEQLSMNACDIADIVVAGNTAMHHLFLGLPIDNLTRVPFAPSVSLAVDIKSRELGLIGLPGAYVHCLPNIAAYVGGDHTAALLALQDNSATQTEIMLDIGTNTEISLMREGHVSSLSCPSGPAFEGGNISCGMRSAAGAIESVDFDGIDFKLKTIDNSPASGICGSGVLDILAKLYLAGVISPQGRLLEHHPRLRSGKKCREFLVLKAPTKDTRDIVFSQLDIRAVQLAKSAIKTGIDILLEDAGISISDVDQIIIAGTFGSYIDLESAKTVGMLPDIDNDKYAQIGNAAGIGAKLALISYPHRAEAKPMVENIRYLELSGLAEFNQKFLLNLNLPEIMS